MGEERVVRAREPRDGLGKGRGIGDQRANSLAQELRVEELLGVLPLVEGLALIEPLSIAAG
jgi:hypothetical protein